MEMLHSYIIRAICKVCGLALLLEVGTLWRCGDGLLFKVPPLASDALLMLHLLLENVLQTIDHFKISCLVVGKAQKSHWMRSELNSVVSLEKVDETLLEHPPCSPDLAPLGLLQP